MRKVFTSWITLFGLILGLVEQTYAIGKTEYEEIKPKIEKWAKINKDYPCCIEKTFLGFDVFVNRDNQLEIFKVVEGYSAYKAGIRKGDVVVKVDGKKVNNKYDAFKIYDRKYSADTITIETQRGDNFFEKSFTLEQFFYPNDMYALYELVYQDIPIKLAIIPREIISSNSDVNKRLENYREYITTYFLTAFESSMLTAFKGHSNFSLVDRHTVNKIIDELKLQSSGLVSKNEEMKLGKLTGATHLLLFDINILDVKWLEYYYNFSSRLIEVKTGKIVASVIFKDKEIRKITKEDLNNYEKLFSDKMPITVDTERRLDKLNCIKDSKCEYHITLVNHASYNVNMQRWNESGVPMIIKSACNQSTRQLLDGGVQLDYIYYGNDGNIFSKIEVTSSQCQKE